MKYNMKKIELGEVVQRAEDPQEEIYMIIRVRPTTTLEELYAADGFCAVAPVHAEEPEEKMQTVTVVDTKPTKAEPKQKNKAVPKGLDKGKIIALHTAGWSVAKIADEMNCTEATIHYHLKKEGLK